jgi:hypothetical protein
MRPIIAFLLLASATPMLAQYEMRKTSDGVLIVSNVVGRKYTFDVPGKTIVPYGKNEADHPYLSTDGTFLQILSVPFTQFDADASAGDEAVLRQQMKYEANNYDVPLASIARTLAKSAVAQYSSGRSCPLLVRVRFDRSSLPFALVAM